MGNTNLITIFLTGLLTGGLTCMAVQGGLLAATLAQREEEKLQEKAKGGNALPILAFLGAKLIAYTLLGFFLGWIGSFFQLSIATKIVLEIAVAVFMFGTAMNILDVHPLFRYFVIQPPRFLTRLVRKQSKSADIFAPALLGAFTIFIPCGTTQAMMALAVATGSPWGGAAILFAFILGTSPVFFILGYVATRLADSFQQNFMRLAAAALIFLSLFTINTALEQTGTSWTFGNMLRSFYCNFDICQLPPTQTATAPVTQAAITIRATGYFPNVINVKAGKPITLTLQNVDGTSCIQSFTIPTLNIQKVIPVGQTATVTFIAPDQPQHIAFMCSMGMFRGTLNVL